MSKQNVRQKEQQVNGQTNFMIVCEKYKKLQTNIKITFQIKHNKFQMMIKIKNSIVIFC